MKMTDLKIGDVAVFEHYDPLPAVVIAVDDDPLQPVQVKWADGTETWPEVKYGFTFIGHSKDTE